MIGCSDIGTTDTCCCGADGLSIVIHGNKDWFLLMLAFGQVLTGSETPSGLWWAGLSVPRHPLGGAAPGPPRRLEQLDVAVWADVDASQNFSEGSHPLMSQRARPLPESGRTVQNRTGRPGTGRTQRASVASSHGRNVSASPSPLPVTVYILRRPPQAQSGTTS